MCGSEVLLGYRSLPDLDLRPAHGKPPLLTHRFRESEAVQIEASEAVQIEAGEAVQIEAQAFVPERVNQDPSGTHLPATAWPRQMRPSQGRVWLSPDRSYP